MSLFFKKIINHGIKKNKKNIINFSFILSIIYFFIRTIDCLFLISFPIGDEVVYVREFSYFLENGFIESIKNGMTIVFTLFSYLIHLITGFGIFSLRIAGLISTLLLILYFFLRLKFFNLNEKKIFFTFLLFLIPTTGASIHGTNDSLFFLSLIIFIFESIIIKKSRKGNNFLILLSSSIMIVTRPVAIIYLGSLFAALVCFSFLVLVLV